MGKTPLMHFNLLSNCYINIFLRSILYTCQFENIYDMTSTCANYVWIMSIFFPFDIFVVCRSFLWQQYICFSTLSNIQIICAASKYSTVLLHINANQHLFFIVNYTTYFIVVTQTSTCLLYCIKKERHNTPIQLENKLYSYHKGETFYCGILNFISMVVLKHTFNISLLLC